MNYIGSKTRLCQSFLPQTVRAVVGQDLSDKVFCDGFAGTHTVGKTFKPLCKKIIATDLETYSKFFGRAYLNIDRPTDTALEMLEWLQKIEPKEGFIYRNYCPGSGSGRMYFTDENGKKIDAIRDKLREMTESRDILQTELAYLTTALVEAADRKANIAGTYGAYLKKFDAPCLRPLELRPLEVQDCGNAGENEVHQWNINWLLKQPQTEGDILYLDPPYNERQYSLYYHLLNTIAESGLEFEPKGKLGLPPNYNKSDYCIRGKVAEVLEDAIKSARFKHIFMSYNNEGLLPCSEIQRIFEKYGKYDRSVTVYQRFKADNARVAKADKTIEYIHILEKI